MNNNDNDPFFSSQPGDDRTIIRPIPGGRQEDLQQMPEAVFSAPATEALPLQKLGKVNPLENAASALLALISQLAYSPSHPNPRQLKQQLVQELQTFKVTAEQAQYDAATIKYASYTLCTAIDEAIFNTPWGRQSGWGEQSLLSTFHGDVSGGEQFFVNLKQLSQTPAKHLHLLELKYLCLSLGFQGRYRLIDNGKEKLAQIREWLADLIRKQNGNPEPALSPHWRGVSRDNTLAKVIPLWLIALGASALLLLLFVSLFFWIEHRSTPSQSQIAQLQVPSVITPVFSPILDPEPIVVPEPEKPLLADTDNEQFNITNGKITLKGKYSFPSGKATLSPEILPAIKELAETLNNGTGAISIIGHTDNVPLRNSLRFPSNWALSKARATAVADEMQKYLSDKTRLKIEGKGDAEPIVANDSAKGRATNRRVEITLHQ